MKLSKLLAAALLTTFSLFALSPAKADEGRSGGESEHSDSHRSDDNGKSWGGEDSGKAGSSSLPIDNQVWFLILAAGIVGCKVVYDKSKAAEAAEEAENSEL